MLRMGGVVLTVAALAATALCRFASAHPSDGLEPLPLPPSYGTDGCDFGPEFNHGDLVFTRPYPDPDTLTNAERYIIVGCQGSTPEQNMLPWTYYIWHCAEALDERLGHVPDQLSEELLREVGARSTATFELFKSPLTGNYPRLTAATASPGDVYIRALTPEEMRFFAGKAKPYQELWYDGKRTDPRTGEVLEKVKLDGKVYYVRVYGWHGVILSELMFTTVPATPTNQ